MKSLTLLTALFLSGCDDSDPHVHCKRDLERLRDDVERLENRFTHAAAELWAAAAERDKQQQISAAEISRLGECISAAQRVSDENRERAISLLMARRPPPSRRSEFKRPRRERPAHPSGEEPRAQCGPCGHSVSSQLTRVTGAALRWATVWTNCAHSARKRSCVVHRPR